MKRRKFWHRWLCGLLAAWLLTAGVAAANTESPSLTPQEAAQMLEELQAYLKENSDMTVAEFAAKMAEKGVEIDISGMDPNSSAWDYLELEKTPEEQLKETGVLTINKGSGLQASLELPGFVKTTEEQIDGKTVTVFWVKPGSACKLYPDMGALLFANLSEKTVSNGVAANGSFSWVQLLEGEKLGMDSSPINVQFITADNPGGFVFGVNPEEKLVQSYMLPYQSSLTLREGYYYTLSVGSFNAPGVGGETVWFALAGSGETEAQEPDEEPDSTAAFSDVPASKWYYETVTKMTELGLFSGVGDGRFAPEKTMTRAEFLAVITRILYQQELEEMTSSQGQPWWTKNYEVALQYGLLTPDELEGGQLNQQISRQEMAMLCVRACGVKGEEAQSLVPTSTIADYGEIDSAYSLYVQQAYSLGLLGGVDAQGAFAPAKSLTRAEGCTVLSRLVYPEDRLTVSLP